jgi:3-deoxy-D-manno-octulosonic-acid transferase
MARIFSWLFNAAYLAAVVLACPWILWSAWRHGKYREGFSEKFLGRVPRRTSSMPCVWLHAVSVGEVNLLSTLIAEIARRRPHWEIVVSTTTKTGYDLARKKYGEYTVFYAPLDFTWSVRQAMQRVRPNILALAELELWPNLIAAAKEQGAKVAIFNGRLSDKSFRGYRRIRPLVASVLRQVDLIASQNEETSQRFLELGSLPSAVRTSGSLKFDGAILNRNNPRTMEARRIASIADEDVVFLAGSTQDPEELYAIEIFKRLRPEHPRLRLIVVPRHKERFDEAADLLADSGLAWKRRTELEAPSVANRDGTSSRWEALLVDAIGELGAWWGTATVGFVGGSFGSRGGAEHARTGRLRRRSLFRAQHLELSRHCESAVGRRRSKGCCQCCRVRRFCPPFSGRTCLGDQTGRARSGAHSRSTRGDCTHRGPTGPAHRRSVASQLRRLGSYKVAFSDSDCDGGPGSSSAVR